MDVSMDIGKELDLQFLDLHDLDDNDKSHLITILKYDANNEALTLPWDTTNNNNIHPLPVTEIPTIPNYWHNAMTQTHSYPQQIMTTMCNDWQSPMYSVSTDGHMSYIPGMTYPHPGYNLNTEMHDVNYVRENGRRGNRGRGMRRDNYNRTLAANDMQSGYMGDQGQFHPQIPIMYFYADHSVSPQHQVPGQIYYPPAIYSSSLHPNAHPHVQPNYPTHHHSPVNRVIRQTQPVMSVINQEYTKSSPMKLSEKCAQDVCTSVKSANQANEEDNSLQANIVTTVIVNNSKLESSAENVDKITANKNHVNSNTKLQQLNVKIEGNVPTASENCNTAEKAGTPSVNINNIVEAKRNGETENKLKNETECNIQGTILNSLPKPVSKTDEDKIEENISKKNIQDKTTKKTPINSIDTVNIPLPASASGVVSKISPDQTWASILKKKLTESRTHSSNKPTVHIGPVLANNVINQNGSSKTPVQITPKESTIINSMSQTQTVSSNTAHTINDYKEPQNDILRNYYDDPIIVRMGEFLSHYQMDKQTVSLLPRGLTNRSNYCYINSILQALLACPPFYNLLMALPQTKTLRKNSSTPLIDNIIRFVREFTPLSDGARLPRKDRIHKRGEDAIVDIQSGVAFEPSYVYTMLKHTSAAGIFSVEGRQEDAEEFLSCLLNGINDEMLELIKLVNNDQNAVSNVENNINCNNGEEEWKIMGPKNKGSITRCTEFGRTPLSDIFRGQLRSRVSRAGEQPTDNVQPFFTLQLDIEKADSVKSALEILVGKDQLEGMRCSKTKQQIEAWKQVTLEELPVILILHLKWFNYKLNGCSKILKSVEFPIDLKIDSKFLSPNAIKKLNPKQKQYKLFAVTYHDGKEATKGHYVTDAFHVGYGSWVRYDDSALKGISENNVLKPTSPRVPYLLYYRRCDTIGNNQSNSGRSR